MRWSTKGRYAVNAMVDLALRESAGPVALAAIAQRQRISLSYLEQLFAKLRQQGLVASSRGPGGGYVLGRAIAEISAADIVRAVEVSLADSSGTESDPAAHLWNDLGDMMLQHLTTVPLQRLVDAQIAQGFIPEDRPARRQPPAITKPKPMRTLAPNSVFALGQRIGL